MRFRKLSRSPFEQYSDFRSIALLSLLDVEFMLVMTLCVEDKRYFVLPQNITFRRRLRLLGYAVERILRMLV